MKSELVGKNNILNKKSLELKDFEINGLDYEKAILLDKRNYFGYYLSFLNYYTI